MTYQSSEGRRIPWGSCSFDRTKVLRSIQIKPCWTGIGPEIVLLSDDFNFGKSKHFCSLSDWYLITLVNMQNLKMAKEWNTVIVTKIWNIIVKSRLHLSNCCKIVCYYYNENSLKRWQTPLQRLNPIRRYANICTYKPLR